MTHFHGYKWDCQATQDGRFTGEQPPEIVRDNLRQRVAAPQTWSKTDAALDWVEASMGPALGRLMWPDSNPPPAEIMASKAAFILDELQRQHDVVWGEWLRGNRLLRCVIVCCEGGIHCPTGR